MVTKVGNFSLQIGNFLLIWGVMRVTLRFVMNELSIYQYQSAREFLKDSLLEKKRVEPQFSIRKFCKTYDFGSHAYLVMILKGKRNLNLKQIPTLSAGLSLNSDEKIYLQTLIQLDNAKSDEEKNLYKLWLNDLNPKREYRIAEVEHYHVIADWIHMAILTLTKIKGAEISAESIYELTNHKVSISKINEALERLFDLNLLVKENGIIKATFNSVRTRDDVSNKGVREYHKQVAKLACDALEEQSPEVREYQSFAFTVPKTKITLAKEMIRKFRHQLCQVMEAEPGDDVYQMNLHFFRLMERPSVEAKALAPKENDGSGIRNNPMTVN
jgi:uncharacterized protein (TIGR02147 family)